MIFQDSYEFLVKAICKRPDSSNLETTTTVRLTVVDRNDASPMFTLLTDKYETTVSDQVRVFTIYIFKRYQINFFIGKD